MKSKNYYRVRRLVRVVFWAGLGIAIYLIATSVWWVDGGYCFGSANTCLVGGL